MKRTNLVLTRSEDTIEHTSTHSDCTTVFAAPDTVLFHLARNARVKNRIRHIEVAVLRYLLQNCLGACLLELAE